MRSPATTRDALPGRPASPALVSAVYLVLLFVAFGLVVRIADYLTLARAGEIDGGWLGPPLSLPFLLGEELLIGGVLAALLGLAWRRRILRALALAPIGGYVVFLALEQLAFKHYLGHFDYVHYSDNHDLLRAGSSVAGSTDGPFLVVLAAAIACVVALSLPLRPRPVRALAGLVRRRPLPALAVGGAYVGLTLALGGLADQHGLERSFPVAFAESYLEVRAEEARLAAALTAAPSPPAGRSGPDDGVQRRPVDAGVGAPDTAPRRLNVVWYLMESASFRETSLDPRQRYDTTPFLAELASRSVLFTRYYPGVAASTRSFFSALTGLHPFVDKTSDLVKYSSLDVPTLADILHADGYATGFFTSSDTLFDSLDAFLATRAFDVYLDKNLVPANERPAGAAGYWGVDEEIVIDRALAWIAEQRAAGRPYYVSYNAVYPHHPFGVPAQHAQLGELDWGDDDVRARYRAALRYADLSVRRFHDGLARLGALEDTLFVVVPDHGEAFGDLHRKNFIHAEHCYEEDSRIFLLLHQPDVLGPPRRDERLGSNVDLLPTLLDVLDRPPSADAVGSSLLAADRVEPRLHCWSRQQLGVREGDLKLVTERRRKRSELYDLAVDPDEQHDLSAERPADVARLRRLAQDWMVEVARDYRDRVRAAGLSERQIGELAGRRRQQLFGATRIKLEAAGICPGAGRAGCVSSGQLSLGRGQGLTAFARAQKGGDTRVKLEIYDPDRKRIHVELVRLGGEREATFATVPGGKFAAGKRYLARISVTSFRAVHDARGIYFSVRE